MNPITKRTAQLAALLGAMVVLGAATGCAGRSVQPYSISPSSTVRPAWSIDEPDAMLAYAAQRFVDGEFEAAIDAYTELLRHWSSPDERFERFVQAQIALASLEIGDNTGFYAAADQIYRLADGRQGRLPDEQRALVALADKRRDHESRINTRTIPPRTRTYLESGPIPLWELKK